MSFKRPKYAKDHLPEFFRTLNERVNGYFKQNQLSKHGGIKIMLKSFVVLAVYIVPYCLLLSGIFTGVVPFIVLWIGMGLGIAGIGLNIMHDANHGSYSNNKTINDLMSKTMVLMGSSCTTWRIQHNVLHHSYTNIEGVDADIPVMRVLRLSPNQPKQYIQKFQHIYAWVLYSLISFSRLVARDFEQLSNFYSMGLIRNGTFTKELIQMIIGKVFYITYSLIIPIILLPQSPWLIISGFMLMHLVAGLILGLIFQTAHIVPTSTYPLPDNDGNMDTDWAVHQLETTANYSNNSPVFSWFVGGLNYQIEHHLFPNISHIHYKNIAGIVAETAKEYGVPYHQQGSFLTAIINHKNMLKTLGS